MQDCCVKCFSSPALGHQTTHVCANARTVEVHDASGVGRSSATPVSNFTVQSVLIAEAYRRAASEIAPASNAG